MKKKRKPSARARVARKLVREPRTCRQLLDVVDLFLSKCSAESGAAWDVLSALRGPDYYDSTELKKSTTLHIRRAALPKLRRTISAFRPGPSGVRPSMEAAERADTRGAKSDHFSRHVQAAMEVLGIKDGDR